MSVSGFRSNFGGTTIDGISGVEDGVKIASLGSHLFFSKNQDESSCAFTSSMWPCQNHSQNAQDEPPMDPRILSGELEIHQLM